MSPKSAITIRVHVSPNDHRTLRIAAATCDCSLTAYIQDVLAERAAEDRTALVTLLDPRTSGPDEPPTPEAIPASTTSTNRAVTAAVSDGAAVNAAVAKLRGDGRGA